MQDRRQAGLILGLILVIPTTLMLVALEVPWWMIGIAFFGGLLFIATASIR